MHGWKLTSWQKQKRSIWHDPAIQQHAALLRLSAKGSPTFRTCFHMRHKPVCEGVGTSAEWKNKRFYNWESRSPCSLCRNAPASMDNTTTLRSVIFKYSFGCELTWNLSVGSLQRHNTQANKGHPVTHIKHGGNLIEELAQSGSARQHPNLKGGNPTTSTS